MERIMRKVWGEWFPGDINIYLMPIVELRVLILIKVNLLCIRNDSGIFILSNVFTCLKDTKTLVPFMRSFFSFWFFGLEILFSLSIVYSKLGKNQCSLFSPYKYPVVTLFWENISFHHWKAFVYFWKIIWPIMFQSTSELYFFYLFLDIFFCNTTLSQLLYIYSKSLIRTFKFSIFFLLKNA